MIQDTRFLKPGMEVLTVSCTRSDGDYVLRPALDLDEPQGVWRTVRFNTLREDKAPGWKWSANAASRLIEFTDGTAAISRPSESWIINGQPA